MKLTILFGEESRFDAPLQRRIRARAASNSGLKSQPWSRTTSFRSPLRQFMGQRRHAIKIPIGFQGETGFPFGVKTDE
jgi:hypothetical protein